MSALGDLEQARMLRVVQSAKAWVQDATSLANDWTAPVDNALIDAIDTYEHPTAAAAGQQCLRDACEEHHALLAGQYLCNRVPGHTGGCRFGAVTDRIGRTG